MPQSLEKIEISGSNRITASVIWLHGLGADGQDFVPVIETLDIPHIRFILPHAPYRSITINQGYEMRGWYDLYGLTLDARQDTTGIEETAELIAGLIASEESRGIPSNRILLAGFSQGGAIALHVALRYPKPLGGILALSTYLPLKNQLASEKSAANQSIPVFMAHGTFDDIISLETCKHSLTALQHAGYQVAWHEYPMGHSVSMQEIEDIRAFLLNMTT